MLNTYGGGTEMAAVILGVMFFGLAAYAIYSAVDALINGFYSFGITFWIGAVIAMIFGIMMINVESPVRHEVTLRTGHVIDAAKYEVVDQRGAIYVIEEREQTEAK